MTEGPDVPFEARRCPLCGGELSFVRWTGTAMVYRCRKCLEDVGVLQ